MLDLAKIFSNAGVHFERPITNHETLWTMWRYPALGELR
jgi:hypothetical protein